MRPGASAFAAAGAVTACLLAAPTATAGTYDVVACGGAAGGAQNAFAAAADAGMTAYSVCPNTPSNVATGLVTRASATGGPGSVPYLAGAYQSFEAPHGASLVSVSFDLAAIRLASHWTTGIVAFDGDFNAGSLPFGCYAGVPGCGIGSQSFFGPLTIGLNGHLRFRFETRCGNPARCDISASGFQPGMRALFSAANVSVRVQDDSQPTITPVAGSLWAGGWHRGNEEAWQWLTDNVGVMILRLYVDGALEESHDYRDAGWPAHVRCDFTRRRPCNDVGGGVALDTRSVSDGRHGIRIEVVDSAGNVAVADRMINVDNTPPAHVRARVDGGDQWSRTNDFHVSWTSPDDGFSPVAKAHFRLCSVNDPARCTTGTRTDARISELARLGVPGPGVYSLRLWLEDEAGNADEDNASDAVFLRFDDVAPTVAFEALDEHDPRRLEARTSDTTSGVVDGSIELRRAGFRQWHPVPTNLRDGHLVAEIDDLGLPDGRYELRARARDRAGNEGVGDRREDGAKMELTLPLRTASSFRIAGAPGARVRRCRKRAARRVRSPRRMARRCRTVRRRALVRGTGKTIRARLETTGGRPLAGAAVSVLEEPRTGGGFRRIATPRTDRLGRVRHTVSRGPSRTIRLQYGGSPLIKPAVTNLKVLVPARTTIAVSRRFLRNGESVRFAGRLAGGPLPDGGKLIDLQAYYRGRWRTFATPRTDSAGRWRFRYRFEATRGLVVYRFRARIRREAAYPYELGRSRTVAVTVRGP